jgi:hypothetical protein
VPSHNLTSLACHRNLGTQLQVKVCHRTPNIMVWESNTEPPGRRSNDRLGILFLRELQEKPRRGQAKRPSLHARRAKSNPHQQQARAGRSSPSSSLASRLASTSPMLLLLDIGSPTCHLGPATRHISLSPSPPLATCLNRSFSSSLATSYLRGCSTNLLQAPSDEGRVVAAMPV